MRKPRKGFGGPQPNSGRKATGVERRCVTATDPQWLEFKKQGGSPWLQGILNLLRADRPEAFVLLLIDDLAKKRGREWLPGLVEKINKKSRIKMRTERKLRYYCDHCKKSGGQKAAMISHESACTKNPDRVCKMCGLIDSEDAPATLAELTAVLPDQNRQVQTFE